MASIILRQSNVVPSPFATIKGAPLTNTEVDNNFANLNVQVSDLSNTLSTFTGSQIANGTSNISISVSNGNAEISTNLFPLSSNLYNIGSATKRFDNLYVKNTVDLGGSVISADAGGNILVGGNIAISSTGTFVGSIDIAQAISTGDITADKLATDSVTSIKIANSNITAEKLASDSVTTAKILDLNVTTGKLADNAVTAAKIADNAVGARQIVATGVSAATYGNSLVVPVITVDVDGRITSAANVLITGTGGSGGGGNFNTAINNAVGYALTTSLATAATMASTSETRYIVHSIMVTNIDSIGGEVTGTFNGTNMTNINFVDTVPVPVNTSVELLKKPKVLYPSAVIALQQTNTLGNLHATITYETVNSNKHFGAGVDIGTADTYQDLITATSDGVIESILLVNDHVSDLDVRATVAWTDGSNNILGYFAYLLVVPANSTIELLDNPKFLPSGNKIRVKANQIDRLEALIAGKYA